ncbi:MAG: hypothetical protein WA790_08755 [Sulfitobacter sp.]
MAFLKSSRAVLAALCLSLAAPVVAEQADYGEVALTGLARESWPYNQSYFIQHAMVCNVNGPDGFLTIRTGPDASFPKARALNRLAVVTVDISQRRGRWIRVVDAQRTVTKDGYSQPLKHLPVQGWAHDGYLCDFIH